MASAKSPRRTPAGAPARKFVKASILVDVESAAASLRGVDRSAFAVEALRAACKGIIVIDKSRKPADEVVPSDEVNRTAA